MDRRIRPAPVSTRLGGVLGGVLGAALLLAGSACREVPRAEAARTPAEQLMADSAHADSTAFEALPPGLGALLDVRALLAPETLANLPLAECAVLRPRREHQQRRQLRLRLEDSSVVLLLAVADRALGTLERVEFVRRTPSAGQRGLIWDRERDRTTSMWWPEFEGRVQRRGERGHLPRGGPVPRAVRALGRQLLTVPCADSAAQARTPR
jgi:hypothetical protein